MLMKNQKQFTEILALIKELEAKCPARKTVSLEEQKKELVDEAVEAGLSVDKKDWVELKEELGDVLWDWMVFCNIAEQKELFSLEEVLELLKIKIKQRNPHVFGNEKANTKEEALEVKRRAKQKWKQREKA